MGMTTAPGSTAAAPGAAWVSLLGGVVVPGGGGVVATTGPEAPASGPAGGGVVVLTAAAGVVVLGAVGRVGPGVARGSGGGRGVPGVPVRAGRVAPGTCAGAEVLRLVVLTPACMDSSNTSTLRKMPAPGQRWLKGTWGKIDAECGMPVKRGRSAADPVNISSVPASLLQALVTLLHVPAAGK